MDTTTGGVYQPSGGLALPSVAHVGAQTDPVELQLSANQCSWESECSADLLSKGTLMYGEWSLHLAIMEQI